jgi:hypothetical protein
MRWIVLVLLLLPTTARGQFFGGYSSKYHSVQGGFGSPFGLNRVKVSFNYRGPLCGPFGCATPFYTSPFSPFAPPVFYYAPPVIQVQAIPLALPQGLLPARFDEELPTDIDLNDFIVVRPRVRNIPRMPAPERLPPIPKVPELNIPPAPLPLEPKRDADARVELNRQLDLGRAAMGDGEFGRALHRFEEAIRVSPQTASGYFHRAQAEFALGKYREAVASIVEGLRLRPDWSSARFQPRELYGNNLGLFDLHLQELKNTLDLRPQDPALLFLYGYQLWFDGRRGEATPILERAIERSQNPEPIQTFLLGGMMVRAK